MFEQTNGLAHRLDAGGLRDLIKAGGTSLRLVFVAACHSEAAARRFLEAGVPCVVAVRLKEQLHDVAAIEFTKQFYVAIASGHTVRQAFEIGRRQVQDRSLLRLPRRRRRRRRHRLDRPRPAEIAARARPPSPEARKPTPWIPLASAGPGS